MIVRCLALILTIAFLAVPRFVDYGEPAGDPFKLHLPEGVKRPMEEKDAKAVYIPDDLDGCFTELGKMLSKAEIEKMKSGPEDQIDRYYYSLTGSEAERCILQFARFLGRYGNSIRRPIWRSGSRSMKSTIPTTWVALSPIPSGGTSTPSRLTSTASSRSVG